MTSRGLRALLGAGTLAIATSCGGDSVTPTSTAPLPSAAAAENERLLAIELTTPSTGDAGLMFSVEGPNITGVTGAPGFEVMATQATSHGRATLDVLVVGPLRNGVVAWLTVKGTNSGNAFSARLTQVAAGANEGFAQRTDLGGYQLTVRR